MKKISMTNPTTLKPCPFCGALDECISYYYNNSGQNFDRAYYRKCDQCGIYGPSGKTLEEADEKWNTRILAK